MDLGLKGRAALVCGGSSGLGKAVATLLAREGANVAVCARTEEKLRKAAEEIERESGGKVLAAPADVSIPAQVKALVQKTAAHSLELNLLSTMHLCREAVPHMKKAGWGRIINITSFAAKQPHEGLILSNTARAGVLGLSKSLANELAAQNILVNTVCPGAFETERHAALLKKRAEQEGIPLEQVSKARSKEIPLGRFGQPEEFANLVVFLASERASYITGTAIQIDGGVTRSLI
jgi:3-oxoacyl-[acyl-carrier protein] reductase